MSKFQKDKKRGMPALSTASLPDIVFMLLFFFMVSTSMRDEDLKDAAKNFIANPLNLETMPEKEAKEFPVVGVIQVTPKATISLQNDRDTQYQTYLAVQNELQRAYNELRDELSIRVFGSPYNDISTEEQDIVRSVYPQRISEAEPRNVGGGK